MALPLPDLDDRRWADLVEEGRALIPVYGPGWTDHNLSDPGITLVELLAWVTEMDVYRVNRIPARHRLKFLALAGVVPAPPVAARSVVAFTLAAGHAPVQLPADLELAAADLLGAPTPVRTLAPVTLVGGRLAALVQSRQGALRDVTGPYRAGEPLAVFGERPAVGDALHLGFTQPFPRGVPVRLHLGFAGPRTGREERARLLDEVRARLAACRHAPPRCAPPCGLAGLPSRAPPAAEDEAAEAPPVALPPHHGVRLAWEAWVASAGASAWQALDPALGTLVDDTRALTLDGGVELRLPRAQVRAPLGPVAEPLYWIRVRLDAGAYDAPPLLRLAIHDAVAVEQAVTGGPITWTLAADAAVTGPTPVPGAVVGVLPRFDVKGQVSAIRFTVPDADVPGWRVLAFTAPRAGKAGLLALEALALGIGNGRPGQALTMDAAPLQRESLEAWALEADGWQRWEERPDLDASGRADRHFQLDPTRGVLSFGDGERGLSPPAGSRFLARCRLTRAEAGNLPAGTAYAIPDTAHDRALLPGLDEVRAAVAAARSVEPGTGGAAAETLDHASDRAADAADSSPRAITLADYEALALATPGTRVARARAFGGLHPSFPCFRAPGLVTLVVIPDLPGPRPVPSPGLLLAVKASLLRRRALGTRVEVVGPGWVEVAVRATLAAAPGVDPAGLRQRAGARLDAFLDPRTGGPDGTGWPFGREVARAELMQVLQQVPGVAHVAALELVVDGCECDPQCDNVCLRPTELVAAGAHQLEVG